MEKSSQIAVTVRLKQQAFDIYRSIMIKKGLSITEDLINHMKKQIKKYELLENNLSLGSDELFRLNLRVDRDLYTKYKIQLVLNHTNTTADVKRYIYYVVENRKKK